MTSPHGRHPSSAAGRGAALKRRFRVAAIALFLCGALLAALWLSGVVTAGTFKSAYALLHYEFTSGDAERQAAGAALYHWHCSSCHGLEPADAALLARQAFSKFGDFELWRRIRSGSLHEEMPAFGNALLSSEEVLDILSYLNGRRDFSGETTLNTQPPLDGVYKYVALNGAVRVYDLDDEYDYVKQIRVRGQFTVRGIAANAGTGRLYVSFNGRKDLIGGLACIDLASDAVLWIREYSPGIDSFALSPDGRTIYMPTGEGLQQQDRGEWLMIDALSGDVRKRVIYGTGPHNTIVSADGKSVYLAPVATTYLGVLDASKQELVGQVGPFGQNVRPFTVTSDGVFALVNVDNLSGFEVTDLKSGKVIHRVQVEGFPWEDPALPQTQSHGVALSPDETEAWVSDAWNRQVHIFDITGLPGRPKQIASVDVTRPDKPETMPKWINFSRDGRYVHISNGAIIDAEAREIVAWAAESRHFVEIHFEEGRPVAAFPRYGVGYRNPAWWVSGK